MSHVSSDSRPLLTASVFSQLIDSSTRMTLPGSGLVLLIFFTKDFALMRLINVHTRKVMFIIQTAITILINE